MIWLDLASVVRASGNKGIALKGVTVMGVLEDVPDGYIQRLPYTDFTKGESTRYALLRCALVRFEATTPNIPKCDNNGNWYAVKGVLATCIRGDLSYKWVTASGNLYCCDHKGLLALNRFTRNSDGTWKTLSISDEQVTQADLNALPDDLHKYYISVCKGENVNVNIPEFYCYKRSDTGIVQTTGNTSEAKGTAIENEVVPKKRGKEDAPLVEENRIDCKSFNDNFSSWMSSCTQANEKKKEYLKRVVNKYREDTSGVDWFDHLKDRLERHWSNKPPIAQTGYSIVKKYTDNWSKLAQKKYLGITAEEAVIGTKRYRGSFLGVMNGDEPDNYTGTAEALYIEAFSDKAKFYYVLLGQVLSLGVDTMLQALSFCSDYAVDPFAVLTQCPYLFCISGCMSFKDAEKIAIVYGVWGKPENADIRKMAIIDSYIDNSDDNSTLYLEKELDGVSFDITYNEYQNTKSTKTATVRGISEDRVPSILSDRQTVMVTLYFNDIPAAYDIPFVQNGTKFAHKVGNSGIVSYIKSGLGVASKGYITSSRLLKMELYVAETMIKMGNRSSGLKDEDISEYVKAYENNAGITLEPQQSQAVHLLTRCAGLVAGCAGSGKSTSTACFVYVIEKLSQNYDIQFCAPTGKASKRMEEVLNRPCKTIHSLFRLGVGEAKGLTDNKAGSETFQHTIFIIDEGAMISLELMYKLLQKIDSDTCRIYMFGDAHQLSPIGKGFVFRNLLRYLPTQFLTVSKRAASGSAITKASNVIANKGIEVPVESGDDFKLIPCSNDRLKDIVIELVEYYVSNKGTGIIDGITLPKVNGVAPDDIQVITPYKRKSPKRSWTADELNESLQPLFEHKQTKLINLKSGGGYNIGSRVIHTSNARMFQQYESCVQQSDGSWVATKKWGYGVMNGEVGKVIGVCHNVFIEDEAEIQPPDWEDYPSNLRDDSSWKGDFLVIKYPGFVILYRMNIDVNGKYWSEDLNMLDLFYAGSVHKMQGSECKLAICCLGSEQAGNFVSNNMLYTMITRGKQLVFLLGDTNGTLNRVCRPSHATDNKLTLGALW